MADEDLTPEVGAEAEVVVPPEDDGQPGEAPPQPTLEDLASEMGWRPQEEFRGDPGKWKPASEFVRTTVDVNRNLNNRLKSMEDSVARMARTSAALTEQAIAEARQKVLDERAEAFTMGDEDAFNRADKKLGELANVPTIDATPPETKDFIARNPWFETDAEARNWAIKRAGQLGEQGIVSPARQIATVEREAKALFPELFPEPKAPARPVPLNTPGNRSAAPAKKGFSALPADVQSAALDYEKRGVCKRDEYARLYFEEQGGVA